MTASVARSVVETVALMGVEGSLLALLGFAIVRAGRLRPGWQAAVWLVVLAKFVLPWGPALPWSLSDLIAALRSHDGGALPVTAPVPAMAAAPVTESSLWLVLGVVWLACALGLLARGLIGHAQALRAARRAPAAPAFAAALLAAFVRRPPRLVIGDPAVGPHVVGVFRPIIVIPPALLRERSELGGGDPAGSAGGAGGKALRGIDRSLLCAALLHELAHVRRYDALGRIVQIFAGAVFFFWPLVRIANRRLDLAREAACDAWALEASELPRPAYARLLVRMAQLRSAAVAMASSCGLEVRVAAVLGPPAQARLGATHWLVLVAWIAVALGGARSAAARGEHATCRYTPQLAEALRLAHPEADRDGDGVLSREEACDFQAELRLRIETPQPDDQVSRLDDIDENLLGQPLCCNCDRGAENSAPWITKRSDACLSE